MVKWSIIAVCMVPVCAGLAGVFLPAFGWFPLYGKSDFTFDIIGHLVSRAGFLHSIWLSIFTALFSTFIAYWLCIFILIYSQHFSYHYWLRKVIAPLLAVPHVTMAVGILLAKHLGTCHLTSQRTLRVFRLGKKSGLGPSRPRTLSKWAVSDEFYGH